MPHWFHMISPSCLWKLSTVRVPLTVSIRLVRAFTSSSVFLNSGWSVLTLPGFWVAR